MGESFAPSRRKGSAKEPTSDRCSSGGPADSSRFTSSGAACGFLYSSAHFCRGQQPIRGGGQEGVGRGSGGGQERVRRWSGGGARAHQVAASPRLAAREGVHRLYHPLLRTKGWLIQPESSEIFSLAHLLLTLPPLPNTIAVTFRNTANAGGRRQSHGRGHTGNCPPDVLETETTVAAAAPH
eukprot:1152177-Prorocentrum_minimum.AAC.1